MYQQCCKANTLYNVLPSRYRLTGMRVRQAFECRQYRNDLSDIAAPLCRFSQLKWFLEENRDVHKTSAHMRFFSSDAFLLLIWCSLLEYTEAGRMRDRCVPTFHVYLSFALLFDSFYDWSLTRIGKAKWMFALLFKSSVVVLIAC